MQAEFRGWHKLLLVLCVILQIGFCWAARERSLHANVDLRAFYAAGTMVRTGHAEQLYRYHDIARLQTSLFGPGQVLPFLYPAVAAWLFVPLSLVPYKTAFLLVLTIDLALVFCAIRLLFPARRFLWISLAVLGFFPVSIALMQGQITFVLLALYAAFAYLEREQRLMAAGVCLALALVKFQIALPIALLYLAWKQYRVIAGFAFGSVIMAATSIATTGLTSTREYLANLMGMSTSTLLDPAAAKLRYGLLASDMPNLHGLAAGLSSNHPVVALLTIAASLLVLALSARCRPSLAAALPAALLVSYHLQPYDLTLLLIPLSLVAWSRSTVAGVLVFIVPMGPWLLVHEQARWMSLGIVAVWLGAGSLLPGSNAELRSRWPLRRLARA